MNAPADVLTSLPSFDDVETAGLDGTLRTGGGSGPEGTYTWEDLARHLLAQARATIAADRPANAFDDDDHYTPAPTRLRIYREETGDDETWHLDGADDHGRYTEDVRRFATQAEALAYAPEFVAENAADHGVTWTWRGRPRTAAEAKARVCV